MTLEIATRDGATTPLVRDYLDGEPALAPFYFGHPHDSAAYSRKAAEVEARFDDAARRAAVSVLRPVSPAAAALLQRVADEQGFVVTTGQQAGLFGGPLLTVYKALTAVRLAERLQAELGRPVAPVFWIASEDHDWDEVRTTTVIGRDRAAVAISLDAAADEPPASMARRPLGASVARAAEQLAALLDDTPAARRIVALVDRAYTPERSVADAFGELLTGLLADYPLSLVYASDRRLKELSAPLLRRELAQTDAHGARVAAQTKRLRTAGYTVQVGITRGAANVHFEDEQGRERLLRRADGWQLRRTGRYMTDAELRSRHEADAGCLSPNVLLRPVVESALLPTLAYVAGPAETAYFAQIGCLFRSHDVMPPIVVPRAGFTLIEPKVRAVLDKHSLQPADVMRPMAELITDVVRDALPADVRAALTELRTALGVGWSTLGNAARAIDPTLEEPLRKLLRASLADVATAEQRIHRHLRLRNDVALRQLERAAASLYPGGTPQERALNALPFLARYGPGLLDRLLEAVDLPLQQGTERWAGPSCVE